MIALQGPLLFLVAATGVIVQSPLQADEAAAAARVRQTVEHLSGLGSRVVGYPGASEAADYIEAEFRAVGLENVRREQFDVVVPIDHGAQIELIDSKHRFFLHSLRPNEVRTTTLPPAGHASAIKYGGAGHLADLHGALEDRILLLEFNSGRRWLDAASLGVRAVIFIEPEETTFTQALEKSATTPIDLPRFWIDRQSGLQLRELLGNGEQAANLTARQDWEARPAFNILGWIGGSAGELGQDTVAVQAYYDAASAVPAIAPGAEASTGMAALLEIARHLADNPPLRRVLLLATSAHFESWQGVTDFVRRHARRHSYYAERLEEPLGIDLFISLDLSTGSDQLGLWNNNYDDKLTRFFAPMGRLIVDHGRHAASELGRNPDRALVNGISPLKGVGWISYMPEPTLPDGWVAMEAGLPAISFMTILDSRLVVGTPLDDVRRVDFQNLHRQVSMLKLVLDRSLDEPALLNIDSDLYKMMLDELRDVSISTLRFPRRSQVPDEPIAGAIVSLRDYWWWFKGVNPTRMYLTDAEGSVYVSAADAGLWTANAFLLEPDTGEIIMAPDLSERSEAHHGKSNPNGSLPLNVRWSEPAQRIIVLFPATAQEMYSMVHPASLSMLNSPTIIDAAGAPPQQFGYSLAHNYDEFAGVFFGVRGPLEKNRQKILVDDLLLLNSQGSGSEEEARGIGFLPAAGPLTRMGLQSARDMWNLDEYRLETLRSHAVESVPLQRLHDRAGEMIERATEAEAVGDWKEYVAATRTALGFETKAYPKILATLNDVIKGIIFFLALLIPAAFFGERLLFAFSDIRQQLLGFGALMLLIWTIMSFVHPAFELAHPLVIVLAFSIMAMAGFVIFLVTSRFNSYMANYRNRVAGIHSADFSRIGAAYVAFMLGISNMRRRKLRTGLTLATITLLTFSVLSFSSFEDRVRFLSFSLATKADRNGLLLRHEWWYKLSPPMLDFARSHFADYGEVVPRNDFLPMDDNNLPGVIDVIFQDQRSEALSLLGLMPEEDSVTGIGKSLIAGSFFERDDEHSCLLSDEMAGDLGVGMDDLGVATIRLLGTDLLVRGLFSVEAVDKLVDLDGGTLTPIDYTQSAFAAAAGPQAVETKDDELDRGPMGFHHLKAEGVVIMPYETTRSLGGDLRSVAVAFDQNVDSRGLIESFLSRIDTDLYAGVRNREGGLDAYRFTSIGLTSVQGLGALVIPFLIAILIILNAMLGAVYERFREIGIYSSVGLAPVHISFLFLAEACVFAVLGVTLGYVLGQTSGRILLSLDLLHGIELNYSSSSGVIAAALVMGVVLLSTLQPARIAARLAVPDTVSRWKPPEPDGDEWRFPFPFNISAADVQGACGFLFAWFDAFSGATAGAFYTENVRLSRADGQHGSLWRVDFEMWLSPYDLGVAQAASIELTPTSTTSMYAIDMTLSRSSGENFHWRRLNPRFFTQLRKQLLIWNTLDAAVRQVHAEAAAKLLDAEPAPSERIATDLVPIGAAERATAAEASRLTACTPDSPRSPFSFRGILVGSLLSLIIALGATYATVVLQGSWMTVNASAPAAIFLFVVVVLVLNLVLAVLNRRFALSRADLVLIYMMMLLAASVPNLNFVGYLVPIIVGAYYFESLETYRPFLPDWLIIDDLAAVNGFYEGLLAGQEIPWGAWLSPLGLWTLFFVVLSFMMICMSVILHRQWSTHERLDYPMAQVPLQMIETAPGEGRFPMIAPLFRNKWTWLGFAIPFILISLPALRTFFPAVPTVSFSSHLPEIFANTGGLNLTVNYAWIGFSFLVNLDISLSIWVFFLLGKLQDSIFHSAGITSTEKLSSYAYQASPDIAHQAFGACVVFVLYGLWVGRRHFRDVLRKAWRPDRGIDDSEELLSYRTAVFGFLFSLLFVGWWLWHSGIPWFVVPPFLACCLIFYIMITRVIATAGIATARSPMIAAFVVISSLGSSVIGAKGIVALALTYPWQSEMRIFPMIACANGLKLAETVRGPKRRLFWAMGLALIISVVGATSMFIYVAYDHGGVNLHNFFMTGLAVRPFNDLKPYFIEATYPDLRGFVFTGIGAAVEAFLITAQHRLHWWPLHPLGFIVANGWLTHSLWFSVFLAWFFKFIIMKYGGMTLYLAARPFFIGIVLGHATTAGLWLTVNWLYGSGGSGRFGYM